MDELIRQIAIHEGFSPKVYTDTTGHISVGYGFNLSDGMTQQQAQLLLENQVQQAKDELHAFPYYQRLDLIRQGALVEMVFNMGLQGFLSFKRMIASIALGNYKEAVMEARASKWAAQIGKNRLDDICYRLLEGKYQN